MNNDLNIHLKKHPPTYMVPNRFEKLAEMPLTPSGKASQGFARTCHLIRRAGADHVQKWGSTYFAIAARRSRLWPAGVVMIGGVLSFLERRQVCPLQRRRVDHGLPDQRASPQLYQTRRGRLPDKQRTQKPAPVAIPSWQYRSAT